jgi:Flp pilus assembly protein TadG
MLFARNRARRGSAVVEMAVVIPVLTLFTLGSVEIGRAMIVKHVLEEAARAGCRVAISEYSVDADVYEMVDLAMDQADLTGYTTDVTPVFTEELGPFEVVTVRVSVPFADVSWFTPNFMTSAVLEGVCVMPAAIDGSGLPDVITGKKNKKNKKDKKNKKNKKNKKLD